MPSDHSFAQHGYDAAGLPTPESTKSFWHSEPSPLLTAHRTTRDLPKVADVVIIGSGVTGTSAAYHLLTNDLPSVSGNDEKATVVMLEAREACWGATGRNGGHCQPLLFEHPHDPSIPRFEMANFHALQQLIEAKSIKCEFVAQHGVRAIYSKQHLTEAELALLTLRETAPDIVERVRLVTDQTKLKQLRVPTATGAVVTNIAARLWPYKLVSHLLTELLTSNDLTGDFNLQTLTPVTSLSAPDKKSGRWTVHTERGSMLADKVVLASNAYTSHLLPEFADLIVPVRGQMSALKPTPSLAGENRLKTSYGFLGEGLDDYLIQRPNETGGHLMFGGGRQAGGLTVGVTNDNELDEKTATYLRSRLMDAMDLPERKPFDQRRRSSTSMPLKRSPIELTATHEWTGIMGFSRDDLPWVGSLEHQHQPGLFVSAGYTGHGMPNAWLCGKAVATMVQKTLSFRNSDSRYNVQDRLAVATAMKTTGLPEAYIISEDRIKRARALEDVGSRDWAEMERAKAKARCDRPPSGYA